MKKLLSTIAVLGAITTGASAEIDCKNLHLSDVEAMKGTIKKTRMKTIKKGLVWHYRIDIKSADCKKWSKIQDETTHKYYSGTNFNQATDQVGVIEQKIRDDNELGPRKKTFTQKMVALDKKNTEMRNSDTWLGAFMRSAENSDTKCIYVGKESVCRMGNMITTSIKTR